MLVSRLNPGSVRGLRIYPTLLGSKSLVPTRNFASRFAEELIQIRNRPVVQEGRRVPYARGRTHSWQPVKLLQFAEPGFLFSVTWRSRSRASSAQPLLESTSR